jgi:diguanylate cyclase (GGDEF)-like protein
LEGVASAVFGEAGSGMTAATLLVYGLFLLLARSRLRRREEIQVALIIICSGFLVAALMVAVAQATLVPTLVLAPLLAVGIALPYATERTLRLLFVIAWLVALTVSVLAEMSSSETTLPNWYEASLRVGSLAVAVTVVLVLLWLFRSQLVGALKQARRSEERAIHDAKHDALTGLPNRTLLLEHLGSLLEQVKRGERQPFSLLFLDLDRFKNVNDSLGHTAGDLLLVEVAYRLKACVHPTDTVVRLGGDEFVVLLNGVTDVEDAKQIAERLRRELEAPFWLSYRKVYSTASIGIVVCPNGYRRPEELLRDADTAMYRAKEGGKARYEVFSVEMRAQAVSLLSLETDLRRAVEREEFAVHYQPIVSLRSGKIVGHEALLRWQHPERGLVFPEEFVPLAEEMGLIVPIGTFVLREACHRTALWQVAFPNLRPLKVSVNLSTIQVAQPGLVEIVRSTLRENGLDGRDLHLELTEGAIMREPEAAAAVLSTLRSLGVRIHIDDFGTGYSSLSLLHRFTVDALKVDRAFVGHMGVGGKEAEIVQTVTTLAHSLGMHVIAEGVDTPERLRILREMGCEYGQGYLFSKPVDARTAEAIIASEKQW